MPKTEKCRWSTARQMHYELKTEFRRRPAQKVRPISRELRLACRWSAIVDLHRRLPRDRSPRRDSATSEQLHRFANDA